MLEPIIAQDTPEGKPLTLAELTTMASQDLYPLGLTDAHIAALDAADCTARAAHTSSNLWQRQLTGMAIRAAERAQGVTLADVAAILGYTPAESEG